MTLRTLAGSTWRGQGELWLDPHGDEAERCECTLAIAADAVTYTWSFRGEPHQGELRLRDGGADFTDTFHSARPMACATVPGSWALVEVAGTYAAGDGPPWGWRIAVSLRPDSDELVLQMTNVAPWGEDGRAVRMIAKRA